MLFDGYRIEKPSSGSLVVIISQVLVSLALEFFRSFLN